MFLLINNYDNENLNEKSVRIKKHVSSPKTYLCSNKNLVQRRKLVILISFHQNIKYYLHES